MAEAEVAIVGGGPAGAALAIRLAAAGVDVALFERQAEPRWRACGVYSSPLTRGRLAALGLAPDTLAALITPIAAMEVISLRGPSVRLDHDAPFACGLDRVRLERSLLDRARQAGARVFEGAAVRDMEPGARACGFVVAGSDVARHWRARIIVGADGPASLVARAFGVDRRAVGRRHGGITQHRADPDDPRHGGDLDSQRRRHGAHVPGPWLVLRCGPCPGRSGQHRHRDGRNDAAPTPCPWSQAGRHRRRHARRAARTRRPLARRAQHGRCSGGTTAGASRGTCRWSWLPAGRRCSRLPRSAQRRRVCIGRWSRPSWPPMPSSRRGRVTRPLSGATLATCALASGPRTSSRGCSRCSWPDPSLLTMPCAVWPLATASATRSERVLADQAPASRALDPRFLVGLLRP